MEGRLCGTPEYDLKPSCCPSWRTGVKEIYLSLQYYTRVKVYAKKTQKSRSATSFTYTRNNQKCASSFSFSLLIIIQNKPTRLTARRKKKNVSFFLSNYDCHYQTVYIHWFYFQFYCFCLYVPSDWKQELHLLVPLTLRMIEFGYGQISAPKIGIPMSKKVNPCTYTWVI